jgi:hypothetical protein
MKIIIGATKTVSKSLKIYQETIPGQHSLDFLQQTTRNIARNKESATTCDLKTEWGCSSLAEEEKYQGKKLSVIRGHNNNNNNNNRCSNTIR